MLDGLSKWQTVIAALITAVAAIVAAVIVAGLTHDDNSLPSSPSTDPSRPSARTEATSVPTPDLTTPSQATPPQVPTPQPTGVVPADFLGEWSGIIDDRLSDYPARIVIEQGGLAERIGSSDYPTLGECSATLILTEALEDTLSVQEVLDPASALAGDCLDEVTLVFQPRADKTIVVDIYTSDTDTAAASGILTRQG